MADKVPHRSFTVRIPVELYCEIAEEAREEGISINAKVGQLLRVGMAEAIDLNERLDQLIRDRLLPELKKDDARNG